MVSAHFPFSLFHFFPLSLLPLASQLRADRTNRPLPRGEVRDMPPEAKVHNSALKRMKADPNYRPGNLILGGGGRGVKRAPKSAGTGDWLLVKEEGDAVGECWVRNPKPAKDKEGNGHKNGERNGEKNGSGKWIIPLFKKE